MTIRDTLMAIRVKKQLMTIHLNGIFSIPLRVCGKVVLLHCRFGTLRTYSVMAPKGSR